jgi:hypothetical protein
MTQPTGFAAALEAHILAIVDGGYRDDLSDCALHRMARNLQPDVVVWLANERIHFRFPDASEISFDSVPGVDIAAQQHVEKVA